MSHSVVEATCGILCGKQARGTSHGAITQNERKTSTGHTGNFFGELVSQAPEASAKPNEQVIEHVRQGLVDCVQTDEAGRQQLTVTLPDENALKNLATTLASLLVAEEK